MGKHVIVGAGPVGCAAAHALAESGHTVKVVSRSGTGPRHESVELVSADAGDAARMASISRGAEALYNCVNLPYHRWSRDWPALAGSLLDTAEATSTRLVIMSNLYGYARGSSPMSENDKLDPPTEKGRVRVAIWLDALASHNAGRVEATEARASDFIGPGLGEGAHMGDRVVPRALAGKSVSVIGSPDQLHSWSYIGDVGALLAVLGTDDRAPGKAWHVPTAPPSTARSLIESMVELAGGTDPIKVRGIPSAALAAARMFSPTIRELRAMTYQFTEPFIMNSAPTESTFGLSPTSTKNALLATIDGYKASTPTR